MRIKLLIFIGFSGFLYGDIQFSKVTELPSELSRHIGFLEGRRQEHLDFNKLKFDYREGKFAPVLPVAHTMVYEPNLPPAPVLARHISVPEGYEAEAVITDPVVEESTGEVPMHSLGELKVWGPTQTFPVNTRTGFFPSQMFKSEMQGRSLRIHVFPVQYHATLKKVRVLRSGDIWVRFRPLAIHSLRKHLLFPFQSVIITREKMLESALELQEFQTRVSGLKSTVITVEMIQSSFAPIDELTYPPGYKDTEGKDSVVTPFDEKTGRGYDYQTARKIAQYLHTYFPSTGSSLRYVTLLGGATEIPPSYYFSLSAGSQNKWGVTDQCYASDKQCTIPQLALGRLPFSTNAEVRNYLDKARHFVFAAKEKTSELSLLGGKAFPESPVYEGELAALRLLETPFASWVQVKKFFRTKLNFNKAALLNIARGASDSRLVYAVDHGEGNRFLIENEAVSSREIETVQAIENPFSPVMASITCSNAAFDEELTREPILFAEKYGKYSIGTTLLRHKAGAVAYFGEARPGVGLAVYKIDSSGNLDLTGTSHGLQLLDTFFSYYVRLGKGRLGDFVFSSQMDFVSSSGNDMKMEPNLWTYYITTLLGDPTLPMPERTEKEISLPVAKSNLALKEGSPFGELVISEAATQYALPVNAPSNVRSELFRMDMDNDFGISMGESLIQVNPNLQGDATVAVPTADVYGARTYFLRLENTVGVPRERQVWFNLRKE